MEETGGKHTPNICKGRPCLSPKVRNRRYFIQMCILLLNIVALKNVLCTDTARYYYECCLHGKYHGHSGTLQTKLK